MLAARALSHRYPGGAGPSLAGLDFRVAPGETFGIVGPAGAGKSTLVKIMVGLIRAYSGEALFLGVELKAWSRDFYERIGVALQAPAHYPRLTARENLAYFARLYAAGGARTGHVTRNAAHAAIAGLLDKVGLAPEADRRVAGFPPGMRKRLGIARALLPYPEALFLDEPYAGLDAVQAGMIRALILERKRAGGTTLVTVRDPAHAAVCDRIAFLAEGRLRSGAGPAV